MSRLIDPFQTFRDDAGEVVSNGTLTFYENGTTTEKNVYSDADLTVVQSNPYTLDGYGRVIGDVWLDGEYSVLLKDSDGGTIRPYDDVSSLTSSGGGGGGSETVQGDTNNKFINGACRVDSTGGSVSISGSYQESEVFGVFAKAQGTPTNGTMDLVKTTSVGTSGYAMQVMGLTTGAGGTVDYRFRFNSVDSRDLVNAAAVFQCNVLQNTGASKTYTISIYKANAEDNFSATTLISASSGTSVSDSVDTKISHSASDMGDCSNGIEVIVSVACGAVTTKDFYIADIVFRKGQSEIVFEQEPFDRDEKALKGITDVPLPPDYVNSTLVISSDSDADHDILVPSGSKCRDATDTSDIELSADITKQLDAVWAEGDNAGGRPSGVTLAGPQWLYFFLITKTNGTVDAGFDTSATPTNLLSDASDYTYYRHIGSVFTDASDNIIGVLNNADIGKGFCFIDIDASMTFAKPPLVDVLRRVVFYGGGGGGSGSGGSATSGGNTSFDSMVAGGGQGGQTAAKSLGGRPSSLDLTYVAKAATGQNGAVGTNTNAAFNGQGGECGIVSIPVGYGVAVDDEDYPVITGGTVGGTKAGNNGGGGSTNVITQANSGGAGAAYVELSGYPITAGISITIGAGGTAGTSAGAGGAGRVKVWI